VLGPTESTAAHLATIQRRRVARGYTIPLVRQTYREDGRIRDETLANVSKLGPHVREVLCQSLAGKWMFTEDGA
jgi:hypothetical protein